MSLSSPPKSEAGPVLSVERVAKSFVMHLRGGITIPAVRSVSFAAGHGDCIVLGGPSGAGKSSILKMIYGNYRTDSGRILVRSRSGAIIDVARAGPREVMGLRRSTMGYVSQFLRTIPRISALDVVAMGTGEASEAVEAQQRAASLLTRLNIPEHLWRLPPSTFSGGEQQRVNIARGFISKLPILLLDEPTASLDAANRAVVVELIDRKKRQGVCCGTATTPRRRSTCPGSPAANCGCRRSASPNRPAAPTPPR